MNIHQSIKHVVEALEPVHGQGMPAAFHEAFRLSQLFGKALHGFSRNADVDITEIGDPVPGILELLDELPLLYVHKPGCFRAIRSFYVESVLY